MVIRKRLLSKKSALSFNNNKDKDSDKSVVSNKSDLSAINGDTFTEDDGRYNEYNIWVDRTRIDYELAFDTLVYKTLPHMCNGKYRMVEYRDFMRVLYDNAYGDAYYRHLPANRKGRVLSCIPTAILIEAIRIGKSLVDTNMRDFDMLNKQSLEWRKRK